MNKGYFPILIELANKINASKEDIIMSYLTKEWNDFYTDKIQNWSNLFNRKLCYEEKSGNFFNNYYDDYTPKTTTQDATNNENENNDNENEDNKEENNENENENVNLFILLLFRLKIMRWKMIKRILNMIWETLNLWMNTIIMKVKSKK